MGNACDRLPWSWGIASSLFNISWMLAFLPPMRLTISSLKLLTTPAGEVNDPGRHRLTHAGIAIIAPPGLRLVREIRPVFAIYLTLQGHVKIYHAAGHVLRSFVLSPCVSAAFPLLLWAGVLRRTFLVVCHDPIQRTSRFYRLRLRCLGLMA